MRNLCLMVAALSGFACSTSEVIETDDAGLAELHAPLSYPSSSGTGSIAFTIPPHDAWGIFAYVVRVDVADPLFPNSCFLSLITHSVNGFTRTQQDPLGMYDADLTSNPVMSGVFAFEQDTANYPNLDVEINCFGLPNSAQYQYMVDSR